MVESKNNKEQFKQTEIGVIPKDWDVINFGETSKIKARIGWQGLTTKEYKTSGDYYLITGTDFINNRVKWETCFFVDEYRYMQDSNIQIKDGDVLITKDGTIGKVAYVENMTKPATLNSGIFVVRPINESYHPKFLFYILNSFYFDNFLKQLTAGSTISHLYQKDIVKFNFPCPRKEEQETIASVLSDIDDLILDIEMLINKKILIKQGTMKNLLTGKQRLSGFNGCWMKKKLYELCDVKGGKRLPKGSKLLDSKTEYPYIRVADMYMGGIKNNELKYISKEIREEIKNYTISSKDIFISVAGTLGLVGCVPEYLDGANLTENANKLCNLKCNQKFLMYTLLSDEIQNIILGISTVGAQPKLALTRIREFEVIIPSSKEEQEAISNILQDLDEEVKSLEEKLYKYKQIKAGMMEELLTGKRRLV